MTTYDTFCSHIILLSYGYMVIVIHRHNAFLCNNFWCCWPISLKIILNNPAQKIEVVIVLAPERKTGKLHIFVIDIEFLFFIRFWSGFFSIETSSIVCLTSINLQKKILKSIFQINNFFVDVLIPVYVIILYANFLHYPFISLDKRHLLIFTNL